MSIVELDMRWMWPVVVGLWGCGGSPSDAPIDSGAPDAPLSADATAGADATTDAAAPLPDARLPVCTDVDGDGYGVGPDCLGPDCDDNDAQLFPGQTELCDGIDNDCDMGIDEGVANCCNVGVDNDFDGFDQCTDCDDTNGGIYPGAPEVCNGADDDCDGPIDEDFDVDGDGYSVCSTDPLLRDCDDNVFAINPGAVEDCGVTGMGNNVDEDCDGFKDEGCNPCDPLDTDGDGVSQCDGDCAPNDPDAAPGLPEICDGKDNDCNKFTIENCGVSDQCNQDLDGDFSNDPDVCREDLICGCVIGANGSCSGDYRCTSFCNTSETGEVGDGCLDDMTCLFDLLRSANVHGCAVTASIPGTLTGGEVCSADDECRSLNCDRICLGPGCNQKYCLDWCGSDVYCPAPGSTCRLARGGGNLDGRCWPVGGPFLGTGAVGSACSSDSQCDHGFCSADTGTCSEACCSDNDCDGGFGCSLGGEQINTNFVFPPDAPAVCSNDGECSTGICFNNECVYRLTETSPMCTVDNAGQGTRRAGAACSANLDCRSDFCEATLGVCVEACCSDSSCPSGLTCELQIVEVPSANNESRVTQARTCVNLSTTAVLSPL